MVMDLRHIELMKSAEIIVRRCLNCKPGERILIVSDTLQSRRIPELIMGAAYSVGADPVLATMLPRKFPGEEPPPPIAGAMKSADAILAVPTSSFSYTRAVEEARRERARVLVAVAITEEMMARTIPIDYQTLTERTLGVLEHLRKTRKARVTTDMGTNLSMEFTMDRKGFMVDGLCLEPGELDWLPAGSAHMAPLEGSAEGKLVVDGSLVPFGILKNPVELTVKKGMVVDIQGGNEAKAYKEFLDSFRDPYVFNIAEIGIGTNPQAKLTGAPIEDERIEGGIIIGIGQNIVHGGKVKAKTHTDAIILNPTLEMDGEIVIEKGKLKI
jgi:leucyl aminopeptidase (aminopeptidase T)